MEMQYNPAGRIGTIGVLTVDDHPIFRQGIRHLLETEPSIEALAEVGSVDEALVWLQTHRADVVLLDHNLPGCTGVAGLGALLQAQADLQIIVLTVCDDDEIFLDAVRSGACGYVLKDGPPDRLLEAIVAAARGECRVSDPMVRTLFQRINIDTAPPTDGAIRYTRELPQGERVTAREQEILEHLAQGLSNKEIARDLGISPNTVRNQLQRLQERLQARNRVQLALYARDLGLG